MGTQTPNNPEPTPSRISMRPSRIGDVVNAETIARTMRAAQAISRR